MSFIAFKQPCTSFYSASQVRWCAEGVIPNPSSQATFDMHSLAEMITKWLHVVSLAYALALSIPRCTTAKGPRCTAMHHTVRNPSTGCKQSVHDQLECSKRAEVRQRAGACSLAQQEGLAAPQLP